SPVLWAKIGESRLIGPELVQETTDKVVLIKERLKAARDHQNSYADNRRKPLEFEVGDQVLLKVSPWKGVVRFGKKGKLAPSCASENPENDDAEYPADRGDNDDDDDDDDDDNDDDDEDDDDDDEDDDDVDEDDEEDEEARMSN
ncbi:hypothetical protein Tco_0788289, partial [Tanacetum coccineum]